MLPATLPGPASARTSPRQDFSRAVRGRDGGMDAKGAGRMNLEQETKKTAPESSDWVAVGVAEARRRALALGFGIVALSTVALLLAIYWQLAHPILWAGTLAVLVYPFHRRVLSLVRGRAAVASSISTVLSLAIIFIPSIFAVSRLISEVRNLWPSLRDSVGPEAFDHIAHLCREFIHSGYLEPND